MNEPTTLSHEAAGPEAQGWLEPGILNGLEGKSFFYPCSGRDYVAPVNLFAPWISDFHFVDKAYFCPKDQDAAYANFDCPSDEFQSGLSKHRDYELTGCEVMGPTTADPVRTEWARRRGQNPFLTPWQVAMGQRTEIYRHAPTGREFRVHFRRDDGVTALRALKATMQLGVFFYRCDTMGEGGSGVMWLQRTLLTEVLAELVDGGLLVTDGSQHNGMGWRQDEGIAHDYAALWKHRGSQPESVDLDDLEFRDREDRIFRCVGHAGVHHSRLALVWKVSRLGRFRRGSHHFGSDFDDLLRQS